MKKLEKRMYRPYKIMFKDVRHNKTKNFNT